MTPQTPGWRVEGDRLVADVTVNGTVPPLQTVHTSTGTTVFVRPLPNDYDPTRPPIELGTWSMGATSGAVPAGRDDDTVVIPAVAPALVDELGPPAPARGRRATRGRGLARSLVNAGALGVLLSAAFLAGQWTTQNGVAPVLPLPASDVHTAAATARLWALNTPAEQQQTCGYLATLGDTRELVLTQWVAHLHSRVGGRLDEVNRGVVAGVLDDACAGRAPDARKG